MGKKILRHRACHCGRVKANKMGAPRLIPHTNGSTREWQKLQCECKTIRTRIADITPDKATDNE